MNSYDVIILGAGASGLMCAAELNRSGRLRIALLEGNRDVGAKLKVSGGGKCNITNVEVAPVNYLGDATFIEAVLDAFPKEALLDFLDAHGIDPVIRKGRYYFCRSSSEEIIDVLRQLCRGVDLQTECMIEGVEKAGERFAIRTSRGTLTAKQVIVATGGASFRSLGATDVGLKIAGEMGHRVIPFAPALVGLTLQPEQFWMKALTGISFPVQIRAGGRLIEEDMLFAHKGISGPAVLSASLYWQKGDICIDFLPGDKVGKLCQGDKLISTAIPLPKRFVKAFLEAVGIGDKPCRRLTQDERERLDRLHAYCLAPSGTFGFTKAEVSKGGVDTTEIDPWSMESRRCKGLYFIGEVMDVTGELGGYNFQWAFASAVVASRALDAM